MSEQTEQPAEQPAQVRKEHVTEGEVHKEDNATKLMKKTESTIDKSRRVCTLSREMIDMLVTQLAAELSNKHLYRTFANYYGTNGWPVLEEYYMMRAAEEEKHHNWIYWYLGYNDAEFQYPKVEAVNVDISNMEMPFIATVDREIETTMGIDKIVEQTVKERDWATHAWLLGNDDEHGRLVLEQVNFCLKV